MSVDNLHTHTLDLNTHLHRMSETHALHIQLHKDVHMHSHLHSDKHVQIHTCITIHTLTVIPSHLYVDFSNG